MSAKTANGKGKKTHSYQWNDIRKRDLYHCCLNEIARGNFTDCGFKCSGWNAILTEFISHNRGAMATKQQILSHMANAKKKYAIFIRLSSS
jgi:hypothetical protein